MTDTEDTALSHQQALINALHAGHGYDHAVDRIELIETHISWVLLAGSFAYKIKKALNLGFLDYTALTQRRFFCDEELRLNGRTAPGLYLGTVSINGTVEGPHINGSGTIIEYAVKMRRFPAEALLSHCLQSHTLSPHHLDQMATRLALFHNTIPSVPATSELGTPDAILQPIMENFEQIEQRVGEPAIVERLHRLRSWSKAEFERLRPRLQQRHDTGFVRECHGDLHLNNMLLWENEIQFFDGIEFNARLRWIDVISEIAFLIMDLKAQGRRDYAQRLLNLYLSLTGDYAGLALLRFYTVYRAMVRAKVAVIGITQHAEPNAAAWKSFYDYLALAEQHTAAGAAYLLITHGLSGSGKTYLSQQLAEQRDIIHIRSDIERKRLHGLAALEGSQSSLRNGIYTPQSSAMTYQRLLELTETILQAGYSVIVDATFMQAAWRKTFFNAAKKRGVAFALLHFFAPKDIMAERVEQRRQIKKDASEADVRVLESQLNTQEALSDDERHNSITIDTSIRTDIEQLARHIEAGMEI